MQVKNINRKVFWFSLPIVTILLSSIGYYWFLTRYIPGIILPLEEQIEYVEFHFNAEKGGEFHLPTGSHIKIPGGILLDRSGKKVTGPVTLKFREFHTAADIFLSGIPMQRMQDRNQYMQSDGMMDLIVEKNGDPLQLSSGSSIDIDLASFGKPDKEFELFYLENNEKWDEGSSFQTVNNDRRDSTLAALPPNPVIPLNPIPDEKELLFTIASNTEHVPHLKAWQDVKFRYIQTESGLEFMDAMSVNWDNAQIKKTDKKRLLISFQFSKSDRTGKIIKHTSNILAEPILTGRKLDLAMKTYEKDMEIYAEKLAKLEAERNRLEMEAGLLSRFSIESFGIYNIDKLGKMDLFASLDVEFDFEKEINPLFNHIMLYVILEDERGVIKLNAADWDKIPASTSATSLAAILPDGTVAYISSDVFREKVKPSSLNKSFAYQFYFKTERIPYEKFIEKIGTQSIPSFV